MNTSCVDALDPPARTVEEFYRDCAVMVESACEVWRATEYRPGRPDPVATRRQLLKGLEACEWHVPSTALWLGISENAVRKKMGAHGIKARRNTVRLKPVYGDNGRWWASAAEAGEELGVGESTVRMNIHQRWRNRKTGAMLSYTPFPGVEYAPRSTGTKAGERQ